MSEAQERRTLEGLSAPVEADIQVRDATMRIEWFVDEGSWWYRLVNAALTFDDVGDVEEPPTEELRQEAILRIAWNVADNLWPDE